MTKILAEEELAETRKQYAIFRSITDGEDKRRIDEIAELKAQLSESIHQMSLMVAENEKLNAAKRPVDLLMAELTRLKSAIPSEEEIEAECKRSGLIPSDHLWQGFEEGAKWLRSRLTEGEKHGTE